MQGMTLSRPSLTLDTSQLLHPAVDQLLTAESKLQLAVTHVLSALNSTIASLEEILKILDKSKGNYNMVYERNWSSSVQG